MLKVIELDIEAALSADTGVWEVALVEFPAIEQELIFFGRQKFYKATDEVSSVACQAIKENEKRGNPAATQVGKVRAQQLCKRDEISLETVKRMYSYLERAKVYNTDNWDDNGTISWKLWGGQPALDWSKRILDSLEKKEEQMEIEPNPCWDGYEPYGTKMLNGQEVPNCIPVKQSKQKFVKPTAGESESEFISRCVPYLMDEGKTQDQALGACYGMWRQEFDYDISALPQYDNYPASGDTDAMLVKPFLMEEGCGCKSQTEEFNVIGYIDGQPVYKTKEEAESVAKDLGCEGSHTHEDENGNLVYMPCEVHPNIGPKGGTIVGDAQIESVGPVQNIEVFSLEDYSPEEIEAVGYLEFLRKTNTEQFERVVGSLRGSSESEVKRRDHKTATTYFRYEQLTGGREPIRDFCDSIEGRYFRRMEIDLLRGLNTQFGHNKEPYSKWLWKGGPNCVHGWVKYIAQGNNIVNQGVVEGTPGTPPKNMPNNGYYSAETKKASERAYAISQQNMSSQMVKLEGELLPDIYDDNIPLYYDPLVAADASYALGCGGIYEEVMMEGIKMFRACGTQMKKAEVEKQMFKSDSEKRMVYTPLMIPNILIPRLDEVTGEKYFVKFTPETIQKIQQKFMTEQRLRETNLEHTNTKFKDVVMVESWIVGAGQDKAYTLGFTKQQIPFGSWMAGYKVLDTEEGNKVWNDYIKPGKVKGASVEGNFILNFSQEKTDEYLLREIINIIKQIK